MSKRLAASCDLEQPKDEQHFAFDASLLVVALPLNQLCLNLWGAPILKLEYSGGLTVHSKKHRAPGSDVSAQSVEQAILAGGLYHAL